MRIITRVLIKLQVADWVHLFLFPNIWFVCTILIYDLMFLGVYFYLAAEYCIRRRELADTWCSSVITYPENDPLSGADTMEFYGQRPWRVGKPEPSDLTKVIKGSLSKLH